MTQLFLKLENVSITIQKKKKGLDSHLKHLLVEKCTMVTFTEQHLQHDMQLQLHTNLTSSVKENTRLQWHRGT